MISRSSKLERKKFDIWIQEWFCGKVFKWVSNDLPSKPPYAASE